MKFRKLNNIIKYCKKDNILIRVESKNDNYFKIFNVENLFYFLKKNYHKNITLHEICYKSQRKLIYDIDCSEEYAKQITNVWNVVENIISYTIDYIFENWNVKIRYDDFVITDNSGYIENIKKYKYSYHIILSSYYFENLNDIIHLATYVQDKIQYDIIDMGIYTKNKNIRLLNSHKLDQFNRNKKLLNSFFIFDECIDIVDINIPNMKISDYNIFDFDLDYKIENVFCKTLLTYFRNSIRLKRIYNNKKINQNEIKVIGDEMFYNCLDLYLEKFGVFYFKYRSSIKYIIDETQYCIRIDLTRCESGFCEICERIHDSENSYFVLYYKNNKLMTIKYKCRIDTSEHIMLLNEYEKKDEYIEENNNNDNNKSSYINKEIEYINKANKFDIVKVERKKIYNF
uniref:DNA primase n=1 Tax=Pithovirus LCDPAC02 TaxID=2506601 RepID=A0A481YQT8_9VIRU|nr:MAG: DNA primase [Pithovirus LCDPAC02]